MRRSRHWSGETESPRGGPRLSVCDCGRNSYTRLWVSPGRQHDTDRTRTLFVCSLPPITSTRTPTPTITDHEPTDAPLTFPTDNEAPIPGLFDAESNKH